MAIVKVAGIQSACGQSREENISRAADLARLAAENGAAIICFEQLFTGTIDGAAVELFVQRARAQKKDFALNDDNRAAVGEVVRLLDGLPLAIELAAARTRMLSPTRLVERMKDRFKLLAGKRGATERQATLRAAIDWSWDLLEPWEQAAFAHSVSAVQKTVDEVNEMSK